jgi:hypothetical protein
MILLIGPKFLLDDQPPDSVKARSTIKIDVSKTTTACGKLPMLVLPIKS